MQFVNRSATLGSTMDKEYHCYIHWPSECRTAACVCNRDQHLKHNVRSSRYYKQGLNISLLL